MRRCTPRRPAARSSSPRRGQRSSPTPTRGSSAGSSRDPSSVSSRRPTKRSPCIGSCSTIPARPRTWAGARASACSTSTPTPTVPGRFWISSASRPGLRRVAELAAVPAPPRDSVLAQLTELERIAIVPALNEEETVGRVIGEIRDFDPGFDIVVVDDGSTDRTAGMAADRGAHVLRLPFNLGIGGAVQTGYRFAFAGVYRSSFLRRLGIRVFAWVVSAVVRQKVTDTTSGFRAVNRKGIALFAADYPHDYPEVEATVMSVKHKLRLREVPVEMRERGGGASSITALRSIYYMTKVLLAIFVGLFRRYAVPFEEEHR